jgi:hypothetical protein
MRCLVTKTMGDGPVANIPPGLDAVAGYVNHSGIGITYPQVVATFPNALHLSITTNGSWAMCADVESGAMKDWTGYQYGYCSVSNVNALIASYGRPAKLWTAHYDPKYGAHICSPSCWPGLVTTADGTQWTDHGGVWDESLLSDDFFATVPVPPPIPPVPPTPQGDDMIASTPSGNGYWICRPDGSVWSYGDAQYHGGTNPGTPTPMPAGHVATGFASHPTSQGYWISTDHNEVYAFGVAGYHGP